MLLQRHWYRQRIMTQAPLAEGRPLKDPEAHHVATASRWTTRHRALAWAMDHGRMLQRGRRPQPTLIWTEAMLVFIDIGERFTQSMGTVA
jgi:hypothetical protein